MFYKDTLARLVSGNVISSDDKVVVFCGGPYDADTLASLNFSNVTITNVDEGYAGKLGGIVWDRQDAELTNYSDGQFDVAIVHAGLHHCRSPHRALAEMYRVAKKAVIVFEARDSLLMRAAVRAGFTPNFELEAVSHEGYRSGGVNNGPVPNFIYRWTEREVEKTIRSLDPEHTEDIRFFYGLRLPTLRFDRVNAPFKRVVLKALSPVARTLTTIFPRQGNQFAFAIIKTGTLREWLQIQDGQVQLSKTHAEARGQAYSAQGTNCNTPQR